MDTGGVFNHEPPGYACPFCAIAAGRDDPRLERGGARLDQSDVVRRTGSAIAFISPRWWPNNHGHVLVVPNEHHENLYDLPARYGHAVHDLVREVAVALRTVYGCDGTSVRQHNEPAGNQDVWHYHVHVFPRYADDELYGSRPYPQLIEAERRRPYAQRLRAHLHGAVPADGTPTAP
jgi:histidine triad (HIT) family protein